MSLRSLQEDEQEKSGVIFDEGSGYDGTGKAPSISRLLADVGPFIIDDDATPSVNMPRKAVLFRRSEIRGEDPDETEDYRSLHISHTWTCF